MPDIILIQQYVVRTWWDRKRIKLRRAIKEEHIWSVLQF